MYFRFSVLILCLCCVSVSSKLCPSMDIRSRLRNFEQLRNCTKIGGYLRLVLFWNETVSPYFPNLKETYPSFPEVKEVTGYLLVFMMPNLYDLGAIFPNLVVIRGRQLLEGNSLMIHHNNQIEQIGLSGLLQIQRGHVQIGKCPNLCYVNTVNWTSLGTSLVDYAEVPKCEHEECAPDCEGHCWAPGRCQRLPDDDCHPECLGCEKPGSPKHCTVCKNWKNGDTCVSECPSDRFLCDELVECLTEKECKSLKLLPTGHWVFGKWCLPADTCPEDHEFLKDSKTCKLCIGGCTKFCEGMKVVAKEQIEELKGCTHIDGDLELRVTDIYAAELLANNLGNIKEISGCLKVARSDAVSSLRFLKNLRRIGGQNSNRQCNNHTVYIYENANLKTLLEVNRIETSGDISIGFHNNPELCHSEIKKFALALGITSSEFKNILREAKDIPPSSNGYNAKCADLTMDVNIIENNPTNVTLRWEPHNSSDLLGYTVFYILADVVDSENSESVSSNMCNNYGWNSRFVSSNTIQLTQLKPFTTYVYWMKIYHMSGVGGSTEKKNFTTLPDTPTEPLAFETNALSPTSINITWDHPKFSNGDLSYYQLIAFVEKDDPKFVGRRNYCLYPHVTETIERKVPVKPTRKKWVNQTEHGTCVCEQILMNDSSCGSSGFVIGFPNNDCSKYMYRLMDRPEEQRLSKRYLPSGRSIARIQTNQTVIYVKISVENTNYILRNLTAFTNYIILFSACNENFRGKPQCSGVLYSAERTHANLTADKVTDIKLKFSEEDAISLTWQDPKNPNGMIVAYNIEFRSEDKSQSTYVPDCITWTQHMKNNFIYNIKGIDPGTYTIKVRPVSLYGPGLYSRYMAFNIKTPMKTWVIYLIVCIFFIFVVIVICLYMWYKKKSYFDKVYLITSINPDYQTAVIIEEKWELSRDDIEINDLLGQGTFGQVFSGYIKSQKLPCAIKTVNEDASVSYRTEFLKEGCVMKSFSDAYHVIKLYGVVSRNGAPLVIMELMERGDLKQYLRNARDSSGISSPEIYQMAAQIADGMAYLTAKKFVHRDLAARNCMVSADRTVKIGDFGMTKDVYETDYYRKGTRELLPVRWMAPESLADGIYSSESDVWSYGIVLWEIVTLAEHPYQGMSNEQVLNFVTSRGTLGRPPQCPDVIWEIIEVCWRNKPKSRPPFLGIVEKLEPLVGPSFTLVSFYHSRAGREYRLNYRQRDNVEVRRYNPEMEQELFEHNSYPQENDIDMLMPQGEGVYFSD